MYILIKNASLIFLLFCFLFLILLLFLLLILRYRLLPHCNPLCLAHCLVPELLHEVAHCELQVFNPLQPMRHEAHLLTYRVKNCKDLLNDMVVRTNKPHEGSLNTGNRESHLLLCRFTKRYRRADRNRY
jgi:hypothetical protein